MWPPIVGLGTALSLDLLLCPAPRRPTLSGWGLLVNTIPYVLLTALASAGAAALFVKSARDRGRTAVRVAAAAIWCAPLMVLIAGRSEWAIVPLIFLVASATVLFPIGGHDASAASVRTDILSIPELRLLRQLPSSLCTAVCIQAAAVAELAGRPLLAGPMLAISTALLSRHAARIGSRRRTSLTLVSLRIVLAGVFTILGMLPYLKMGGGSASAGYGDQNGSGAAEKDGPVGEPSVRLDVGESYRGIILWPPVQRHVTLVPPLPARGHDPFRTNPHPLDIPFYGAYWLFRPPFSRPPDGSIEMHGNPTDLTFRSQSARPLLMEAHQNLGKLIDLSCCDRIEIAISNRDRYAATVSLELVLVNTSLSEKPSQSLGTASVTSSPGYVPVKGSTVVSELLRFRIPEVRFIRQFDEFLVRFQRIPVRSHQSANIAIERFVLVPPGQ